MLAACHSTDVELCYDEHPHRSEIAFTFDIQGAHDNLDTMAIFAIRNLNLLRYYMLVDIKPDGTPSSGKMVAPEPFREPFDPEDANSDHKLTLHTGDYDLLAFSGNTGYYDNNLQQVLTGTVDDIDSLCITYHSYPSTSGHPILQRFSYWRSENTYSDYIIGGDILPIYMAQNSLSVPKETTARPIPCHFIANNICQHITIEFDITKSDYTDAVVDSVICELSGIPHRMYLFKNTVDVSRTFKTLYKATLSKQPDDQIGDESVTVKGEVWVTGLVRSAKQSYTTGPGILTIRVYFRDGKGRNNEATAFINLYNTLSSVETSSLIEKDNGEIVQRTKELYINLAPAILDLKNAILTSEKEIGIDEWWSPLGANKEIPLDI